ncbi:MAG: histidine kinase [Spirochaetia bacterium]|nr:histidine kinase [Spirochaetia bacterium]
MKKLRKLFNLSQKKIVDDLSAELSKRDYPSSKLLIPLVLFSVFTGEILVEHNLEKFIVLEYPYKAIVNSIVLSFIVFPGVYFSIYKPLILRIQKSRRITADLRKDKEILDEKIKDRTKELKLSNKELKEKIKEYDRAKKALKKMRDYNEKIISSLSPLCIIDKSFNITFTNEAFQKEFSYDKKSDGKKNLFSLLKINTNEKKTIKDKINITHEESIQHFEIKIRRKFFSLAMFRFETGVVIIITDTTERKELELRVQKLSTEVINSHEKERERLAKDLHDSVVQTISAAKLNFKSFEKEPSKSLIYYYRGQELLSKANQELREACENLFPSILTNLGIESTLNWHSRHYLIENNIKTNIKTEIKEEIPHEIQVHLYRIFQEIISNILRHSKANKVKINCYAIKNNQVDMIIEDNGIGFSLEEALKKQKSFGLNSIRQRIEAMNGKLSIESKKNIGTKYKICVVWESKNETGKNISG